MQIVIIKFFYKFFAKKILFLLDAETAHNIVLNSSEFIFKTTLLQSIFKKALSFQDTTISQKISGIEFTNPIGLSAGLDYEAKLTNTTPALNFGFHTIGTITYNPYEGNDKPRLGRLIKSKSLMVNKGFKNLGAAKTIEKLRKLNLKIPTGVSIGRTNSKDLSLDGSIEDISNCFKDFEDSKLKNKYYELNISCPNLHGDVDFYNPKKLNLLLSEIDRLNISKPIFIKMPISLADKEVLSMMEVIINHKIEGVIIGNLQKNREDRSFIKEELKKFTTGNFSGKPTFRRSNELISLVYRRYGQKIRIIGCGGVFSGEDAYTKIKLGASLVQLITGMIFEGPTVVSEINLELSRLIKKDGYKNITEAVGRDISI